VPFLVITVVVAAVNNCNDGGMMSEDVKHISYSVKVKIEMTITLSVKEKYRMQNCRHD